MMVIFELSLSVFVVVCFLVMLLLIMMVLVCGVLVMLFSSMLWFFCECSSECDFMMMDR